MNRIDFALISRLANILMPGMRQTNNVDAMLVDKLMHCDLTFTEAVDIKKRLQDISSFTQFSVDNLVIGFSQILLKGFADSSDIKGLHYSGIPIARIFSEIYPEIEGVKIIPAIAIKECLIAMTNEGGLFYRKAVL